MSTALFGVGYPTSIVVLTRIAPVVRERRVGWFVAHQAAVAAIAAGWAVKGRAGGVVVNGAWLAVATAWWMRASPARAPSI
ncbi:MAG TPA: hypothetical protein VMZ51_02385 [Acidimicrobiales bacterium]|nr:hypothetical protein [Acidimicrobiales bacterium]